MADEKRKKMSVADILAAARKGEGGGEAKKHAPVSSEDAAGGVSAPKKASSAKEAAEKKGKPGERPGVSDILAMARGGGKQKGDADKPKPAAKNKAASPKAASPKAASPKAASPKAAASKASPAKAGGHKDTASILAAARKSDKPGPTSKAEAAVKPAEKEAAAALKSTAVKKRLSLPPMPTKPTLAKRPAAKKKGKSDGDRRTFLVAMFGSFMGIGYTSMAAASGLWALGLTRFFFPNILTEPPSQFKVGFPGAFSPGVVETKFKATFGVWLINTIYKGEQQIFALKSVCTHLGCTPNWLDGEQKFKCPCHGSGFYKDGINFEGPAPRPLERYAITVADDGQLEIDKSKTYQEELGQWSDPASFVAASA